jgi:hypothetical protein
MPAAFLADFQRCGASAGEERAGYNRPAVWPGSGSRCTARIARSVGDYVLQLVVMEKVTGRHVVTHLGLTFGHHT